MPLLLIAIGVIGGIIATAGAILALGFELKVGLYITGLGTIIVLIEFIIDEWRRWRKEKEKKDEDEE